jgi:hypothetical protein
MLDHLASVYTNLNRVRDARHDYNALVMRRDQTFAEFQTTFLHLAGEAEVPQASLQMDLYDRITPALQRGIAPNRTSNSLQALRTQATSTTPGDFSLINGLLLYQGKLVVPTDDQLIVDLIREAHD